MRPAPTSPRFWFRLRSISLRFLVSAFLGVSDAYCQADDSAPPAGLPVVAPAPNDWLAIPADVVRPIEIQTVARRPAANIAEPGPDMGDFPNSAFTLPKGAVYVESAPFTYAGADSNNAASYNWPFLLRYGVTDDVEFRLLGNGGTTVYDAEPVSGFGPLIFDTKIHLWDGNDALIPACSFEAYLVSDWGSPEFQSGWQPSLNLNFDLPITRKTNLEWSLGYSGVRDAVDVTTNQRFIPRHGHTAQFIHLSGINVYQFTLQWAVEQTVTDRITLFVHGYYAGEILLQQGAGNVVGGGGFYQFNNHWMAFCSCNAGLDDAVAPLSGQAGLAWAP